ncbi:hypothetical protein [Moraxella boevrei]|uniref:hypothetical protein n=1 Tax=Faucicola boevrei TaxID=346665 RepID=UPI00373528FE
MSLNETCRECDTELMNIPAKAIGGATAGLALGSVVPVLGSGAGALIGGLTGAVASAFSDNNSYVKFCRNCKKAR